MIRQPCLISTPSAHRSKTSTGAPPPSGGIFDFDARQERLTEVSRELEDPEIWNDPERAQNLGRERARLEDVVLTLSKMGQALQDAGAQLLVLECVPSALGGQVADALRIPVIGIGAGAACDGQVLVMHDMLGLGERAPKFVANFLNGATSIEDAFIAYVRAVREGQFPAAEHSY